MRSLPAFLLLFVTAAHAATPTPEQQAWLNGLTSARGVCSQLGERWELQKEDVLLDPVNGHLRVRMIEGSQQLVPLGALVAGPNQMDLAQVWYTKSPRGIYQIFCYLPKP